MLPYLRKVKCNYRTHALVGFLVSVALGPAGCGPSGTREVVVEEEEEDAAVPVTRDAGADVRAGGSGGGAGGMGGTGGGQADARPSDMGPASSDASDGAVAQTDGPDAGGGTDGGGVTDAGEDGAPPVDMGGADAAVDGAADAAKMGPVTLMAEADAYVQASVATMNFGAVNDLLVKTTIGNTGLNRKAYVRFGVGGLPRVGKATLVVMAETNQAATRVDMAVHSSTGAWTEAQVTWDTRPASGARLARVTIDGMPPKEYRIDVSTHVRDRVQAGATEITFALEGAEDSDPVIRVRSRETGQASAPKLVVEPAP